MKLLHTKQGLLKRFTAMFLSMCCMLSMFPAAGAASSKNKKVRCTRAADFQLHDFFHFPTHLFASV